MIKTGDRKTRIVMLANTHHFPQFHQAPAKLAQSCALWLTVGNGRKRKLVLKHDGDDGHWRAQCCCAEWETKTHIRAVPCKMLARGMQMIRRYFPIQSDFPHARIRSRRTVSSWSQRCQVSVFGRRSEAESWLLWVSGWHTCGQCGKFAAASSACDG